MTVVHTIDRDLLLSLLSASLAAVLVVWVVGEALLRTPVPIDRTPLGPAAMNRLRAILANEKVASALKGAAIAAAGAVVPVVVELASSGALGVYGPIVGAVASIAVNALRLAVQKDA